MTGVPPRCAADRCKLDHSASGWDGDQNGQPSTTRAARDQGQDRKNCTSWVIWCVRKVNDVAMPKLPPPPPRHAQNGSLFWGALQVGPVRSAVTMLTA